MLCFPVGLRCKMQRLAIEAAAPAQEVLRSCCIVSCHIWRRSVLLAPAAAAGPPGPPEPPGPPDPGSGPVVALGTGGVLLFFFRRCRRRRERRESRLPPLELDLRRQSWRRLREASRRGWRLPRGDGFSCGSSSRSSAGSGESASTSPRR